LHTIDDHAALADEQSEKIGLKYVADDNSLTVAFPNGSMSQISLESTLNGTISEIGAIEGGIKAMAWSPDEEIVILVTGTFRALLMTKDFDVLSEFDIETRDKGEEVSVSIGWGSKETQFHGKAGKEAAKVTDTSLPCLSLDDDWQPRVSWKGDGSLFAISLVDLHPSPKRTIRTYSRDGVLQSTSQNVDQLGQCVAWKPNGSLIASTKSYPDHLEILFFEPNGLVHGDFRLRTVPLPPSVYVKELMWNCDSTILLCWLQDKSEPSNHVLQLWSMNNYHWYLKQTINVVDCKDVQWDALNALGLHILTPVDYRYLKWTWEVLRSPVVESAHSGAVGVIDGVTLLHTPFLYANVPPPYSQSQLQFPGPIKHAAWCLEVASLDWIVGLTENIKNQELVIFEPKDTTARSFELRKVIRYKIVLSLIFQFPLTHAILTPHFT
jgi:elongator complex protein 1